MTKGMFHHILGCEAAIKANAPAMLSTNGASHHSLGF